MLEGLLTMKQRLDCVYLLVALAKALLIAWALTLMYLVEYFGWHLYREAGGSVVSALGLSGR